MLQLWQTTIRRTLTAQPPTYGLRWRPQLNVLCLKCKFSTSIRSLAQKKATPLQKAPKAALKLSKPTPSTPRKPAAYESLSEKLALRPSQTLLYQASSYNHYIIASYMVGGFLISVGAFNAQTPNFAQPGDLPVYVPVFAGVGSFMIACIGFWMCLKPQNIVQAISFLPSPANSKSRTLLLQIERASSVPFRRTKIVEVPPGDVTLASPIFNNDHEQNIAAAMAAIVRREKQLQAFAKTNLLTLPFRQASYWMWRGFIGVRRAFTSEGFNYLHVKGYNRVWKLDREPAWALEDGKALDKLVKIKLR